MAGILAGSFESLDKLIGTTKEELITIDGVGPVVAESIVEFFKKHENRKIIDDMIANWVMIFRDNAHKQGTLVQEFLPTGTLETLTRSEERAIEEAGKGCRFCEPENRSIRDSGHHPGQSSIGHKNSVLISLMNKP